MSYSVQDVVHWFVIHGYEQRGNGVSEAVKWEGLRWELRQKYDWYFKYRAALMQVQHPKWDIDMHWGNEPAVGKTLIQIIEQKISSKQANVTKIKNNIELAKKHWNTMFPIEEEEDYKKAVLKLAKNEFELLTLKQQLRNEKDNNSIG